MRRRCSNLQQAELRDTATATTRAMQATLWSMSGSPFQDHIGQAMASRIPNRGFAIRPARAASRIRHIQDGLRSYCSEFPLQRAVSACTIRQLKLELQTYL